jgi:hypothetical protein
MQDYGHKNYYLISTNLVSWQDIHNILCVIYSKFWTEECEVHSKYLHLATVLTCNFLPLIQSLQHNNPILTKTISCPVPVFL